MQRCLVLGLLCLLIFGTAASGADEEIQKLTKQLLNSKSESERFDAASALAEKGAEAKEAVDALITALRDKSPEVRGQAAKALGAIGEAAQKAVPSLLNLVRRDPKAREAAAEALVKIGEKAAKSLAEMASTPRVYTDASIRQTAVTALGELGPKLKSGPIKANVVSALKKALSDPDKKVPLLAIEALGKMGADAQDVLPTLIKSYFDHKDAAVRRASIVAASKIGAEVKNGPPTSLMSGLKGALKDSDPGVRKAAVEALGAMGPKAKEVVVALLGLFEDKDAGVKMAAIAAVGQIGADSKAAAKAFGDLLKDQNVGPKVRQTIAGALLKMGKTGVPPLIDALKDENYFIRIEVLNAMAQGDGGIIPHEAVPYLLTGLSDPNTNIKKQSQACLDKLGKNAGVALAAALKNKDEKVQLAAAKALEKSGVEDKAAVPDLAAGLKNPSEYIRGVCAEALAKLGQDAEGATAELIAAVTDKSDTVRKHVGQALKNIGRKVLPKLVEMLKDKDPVVRAGAAAALGELGKIAQTAVPNLQALAKDPDKSVQDAARAAVGKIVKESPFALEELLKSPDDEARVNASQALTDGGQSVRLILPTLLACLEKDKNPKVRRNCAAALKGAVDAENAKDIVAKLIVALKDPDAEVRAQACATLGEFQKNAEPAIPHLLAACGDKSDMVPKAAAEALGKLGAPALPALTTALQDPNPIVRRSAAVAIKDISADIGAKAKPAVSALTLVLRDADLETRQNAVQALKEIGADAKPAEIDLIFAMLHDKDKDVRASAGLALLNTQPAIHLSVPAFIQALRDKHPGVTDAAVQALSKWGPQAVGPLTDALKNNDPQVRRLAVDILSQVGPAAKPALPTLKDMSARDPDPKIRTAADKAIQAIEAK